jgi:cyanophycinase
MHINSAQANGGQLLAIGGAEDRAAGGSELLRTFAELSGGSAARIVLVTAASGTPGVSFAEYSAAFHRLGVPEIRELQLASANGEQTRTELAGATGVFLTGGDQSRLGVLVGSAANRIMSGRLADNTLVIAGTSAGATALGSTMILGGDACGRPRTGPGLGLVPGVIVDMHFTQRGRLPRLVAAVRRHPGHLGIGIDEDTAILIGSSRFDVLGRGAVVTVDVRPGSAPRQHTLRADDAFDLEHRAQTGTRTAQGRVEETNANR